MITFRGHGTTSPPAVTGAMSSLRNDQPCRPISWLAPLVLPVPPVETSMSASPSRQIALLWASATSRAKSRISSSTMKWTTR